MITVVPVSPVRLEGALSVILPIQQEEFGIPVMIDDQPDLLDIPGFYQTGKGNFWVALANGKVVGTAALLDIGGGQAAMRKMFVKADFRGQGRGVASFHAAHRFYEKNGFTEIPRSSLPSSFPVMKVDTKFYRRALRVPG